VQKVHATFSALLLNINWYNVFGGLGESDEIY